MPSLDLYKKRLQQRGNTVGQDHKYNSDLIMEQTWDRDIQSKICYIYDYHHDDQWWKNTGITHEHTTKTRIDAKFVIAKYVRIFPIPKPAISVRRINVTNLWYVWWKHREML